MGAVSAEYLTPDEVAAALKCGRSLVYDLVHEGHLRHVRLGNGPKARIRIPSNALDELVRSRESPAGRAADRFIETAVEPRAHDGGNREKRHD